MPEARIRRRREQPANPVISGFSRVEPDEASSIIWSGNDSESAKLKMMSTAFMTKGVFPLIEIENAYPV